MTGAGQVLKKARPDLKIVTTEPASARLLAGGEFKPHKIQGWTPDFVPAVLDRTIFDDNIPVTDEESVATARALAQQEGLFVGISSGGTFAAALKVAEKAPEGSVILAILPDTAERYLSTVLFEGIAEGSDPEPDGGAKLP
jgi:cysteine synthase A